MRGRLIVLVTVLTIFATLGTSDIIDNDPQVNITATGCGSTKVCMELPGDCDPAGNQTCLFMSGVANPLDAAGDTNLTVELSGQSSGYIALGLVVNASEDTTMGFICGQNPLDNTTFFFSTVERNNTDGSITPTNMTVTEIQGNVEGNTIQCQFIVPVTNTNFSILLGNGTIDLDGLGPFNVALMSGPLDFADPPINANSTAEPITAMTTKPPKGASGALQPHALILLLSILTLSVLQKA